MSSRLFLLVLCASLLSGGCVTRESSPGPDAGAAPESAPLSAPRAADPSPAAEAPAGPELTDFSCELALGAAPATLKAGGPRTTFKVKLTNRSQAGETWPALLPGRSAVRSVNLASHWQSGDFISEGDRTYLPGDLPPGKQVELELKITPPDRAGVYILKVEPVQEAVAWFSGKKGCFKEVKVEVTP